MYECLQGCRDFIFARKTNDTHEFFTSLEELRGLRCLKGLGGLGLEACGGAKLKRVVCLKGPGELEGLTGLKLLKHLNGLGP